MLEKRNSFEEALITKRKIRTQKMNLPIQLSLTMADSESINSSVHRQVTCSGFFESFGLFLSSPEDNLKTFRYPILVLQLLLILSTVVSVSLPLYFRGIFRKAVITIQHVLYWQFWSSLLLFTWTTLSSMKEGGRENQMKVRFWSLITKQEVVQFLIDSCLYLFFVITFLFVSEQIENLFIVNLQLLAMTFRVCFKMGRSISLTSAMLKGALGVVVGFFFGVFFFTRWREDYPLSKGVLSLLAALAGGALWLRNRETNSNLSLSNKMYFCNICCCLWTLAASIAIYGASGLFDFFFTHVFSLVVYSLLVFISFVLKTGVGNYFEDTLPTLVSFFEPLFMYALCVIGEIFHSNRWANLFNELVELGLRSALMFVALIAPQIVVFIEIKKSELNLEGGKLGFRLAQRDYMKEKHFEMLEMMNI